MTEQKQEEKKVEEVKVEKTAEQLLKEEQEKQEAARKKAEIYHKIADSIDQVSSKLEQSIEKGKELKPVKENSPALTLGIVLFLVMALIKAPELAMYLIIGLLVGFAPKIIRMFFKK